MGRRLLVAMDSRNNDNEESHVVGIDDLSSLKGIA